MRPLTSHNARTHNVILKVTVPKRTGRKRKRDSDGPFEGRVHEADGAEIASHAPEDVRSRERLDQPKVLRRKLIDNVDKYTIEPVGVVTNTHRYRGQNLNHNVAQVQDLTSVTMQDLPTSSTQWATPVS